MMNNDDRFGPVLFLIAGVLIAAIFCVYWGTLARPSRQVVRIVRTHKGEYECKIKGGHRHETDSLDEALAWVTKTLRTKYEAIEQIRSLSENKEIEP